MSSLNTEEVGTLLFGAARAWRTRLDQRLRPLGLSQGKWRTLVHLSRGGEKLTQKELAHRMGIEGPTLAGLLDRLQNDGWVERRAAVGDRRYKTVHLQRRSKSVLSKIFNTAHDLRHELLEDISARDLAICMRVLSRIREKAEQPVAHISNGQRNGTEARVSS
ncbi:MAG: MarR family transcriptional regulator [Chthoniobacterales bacterium]|nr:MarR family transcriptional regulator [Chthoniobacterales bacterium]